MDSTVRRNIRKLFSSNRISNFKGWVIVLPFLPAGVFLAVLRLCLLLNFLIAHQILGLFLEEESGIFKLINNLFFMILGIRVKIHGAPSANADVIVCNSRSHIDGFVFSHATNTFSEDRWNLTPFLHKVLRLRKKSSLRLPNLEVGKSPNMVIFPENVPTSGVGILQFDQSYFVNLKSVQPCAITASRHMPIAMSTINSGFCSDLFWTFFQPAFTTFNISLSEISICREDMDDDEFVEAVSAKTAEMLAVPVLPVCSRDKIEYLKLLEKEKTERSRQMPAVSPALDKMATQVQEVTPHVPRDVILRDLVKTNSVNVTLANIFEGVVTFTPVETKPQVSVPQKNTGKEIPRTDFEKRKMDFYEQARQRYKEKHGL